MGKIANLRFESGVIKGLRKRGRFFWVHLVS